MPFSQKDACEILAWPPPSDQTMTSKLRLPNVKSEAWRSFPFTFHFGVFGFETCQMIEREQVTGVIPRFAVVQ